MNRIVLCIALLTCSLAATASFGQELPEPPKPQKEHKFLQKFVGKWETKSEGSAGPGEEGKITCTGTMEARMLGGFWVVCESEINMVGAPMKALQTIGYDTEKKKYVGTWIDSMYNHMWKYEGTVNEAGTTLTLNAEGPNMMQPGATALYRDIYEFKSADEIAVRSEIKGPDGKWITFMTGTAKRKK